MIQMTEIQKSFANKLVLDGVSFQVQPQEIFGLLGPSGSGKTTIINILTDQLKHDSGSKSIEATAFETGLMLDQDGLYERLTVFDNLDIFANIYNISSDKITEALEEVGLEEVQKTEVSKLSKGMRQRLAMARAILHKPLILFLDEPTSGLDPVTANQVHKLILKMREQGTTIFLTTHNMDEAVKLCDRIGLLYQGKIVETGNPYEICQRHNAMKTVPDLEKVFFKMTGANLA